ncbi:MAG: hypothetical protein JWL63_11 [Rhodocyclales bacterium]|nr:hypothetical protein [Rhodocyclales bacterium]
MKKATQRVAFFVLGVELSTYNLVFKLFQLTRRENTTKKKILIMLGHRILLTHDTGTYIGLNSK